MNKITVLSTQEHTMIMNEEELQLYKHLTIGKIKGITIDHTQGNIYIELEDGVSIDIIGGEDEVTVEYSGISTVENLEKYS